MLKCFSAPSSPKLPVQSAYTAALFPPSNSPAPPPPAARTCVHSRRARVFIARGFSCKAASGRRAAVSCHCDARLAPAPLSAVICFPQPWLRRRPPPSITYPVSYLCFMWFVNSQDCGAHGGGGRRGHGSPEPAGSGGGFAGIPLL
jgi:hypothetical protein